MKQVLYCRSKFGAQVLITYAHSATGRAAFHATKHRSDRHKFATFGVLTPRVPGVLVVEGVVAAGESPLPRCGVGDRDGAVLATASRQSL
jgi:hypothetical protein